MGIYADNLGVKLPKRKKHLSFSSLIKTIEDIFYNIPDEREQKRIKHTIHDILMSGLAMMFFQEPSLLQFQKRLEKDIHTNNLKTLFNVSTIPKETQMRDIIDTIDYRYLYPVFRELFKPLQRAKYLTQYYSFLDKYYLVTIDGSSYFSSEKIHCPLCLVRRIRKKKTKKSGKDLSYTDSNTNNNNNEYTIRYEHQILQAAIVHPDMRQVIVLPPEPILNNINNNNVSDYINSIGDPKDTKNSRDSKNSRDTKDTTTNIPITTTTTTIPITTTSPTKITTTTSLTFQKQDCEINAAKRLILRIRKEHPKLNMIVVADSLHSKEPFIRKLTENRYHYILSVKEKDHKLLMEWIREQEYLNEVSKKEITHTIGKKVKKEKTYIYKWINSVPLNGREDTLWVNYFELSIYDTESDKITYYNSWITDIPITGDNIVELVKGARARWKIENECFNTLKNQGYHIEHNYGHGTRYLSMNFFLLNLIAFFIHQILELTDKFYRELEKREGTRKALWEILRVTINLMVFTSWELLLMFIYNPKLMNIRIGPD